MQHAAVEGHEVAAEASVRLVAPDDAQVRPLEDADDPSLGAALAAALDTGDDTVAVERLADVRRGDEDVRLSLAPFVRDDEAVARRAARQPSDDEVHPRGQADARAADLDQSAVRDQPAQHGLQRAPAGSVERQALGQLAHADRLAEARDVLEHPAFEAIGVVYGGSPGRGSKGLVPEVGLEPTLAEANTALNRARLPIPPLRQGAAMNPSKDLASPQRTRHERTSLGRRSIQARAGADGRALVRFRGQIALARSLACHCATATWPTSPPARRLLYSTSGAESRPRRR